MERKIIQIATLPDPHEFRCGVVALCNDGTLFVASDVSEYDSSNVWVMLPNVPQPTEG